MVGRWIGWTGCKPACAVAVEVWLSEIASRSTGRSRPRPSTLVGGRSAGGKGGEDALDALNALRLAVIAAQATKREGQGKGEGIQPPRTKASRRVSSSHGPCVSLSRQAAARATHTCTHNLHAQKKPNANFVRRQLYKRRKQKTEKTQTQKHTKKKSFVFVVLFYNKNFSICRSCFRL